MHSFSCSHIRMVCTACQSKIKNSINRNNPRPSILGTSVGGYFCSLFVSSIILCTYSFYRFSDAFLFSDSVFLMLYIDYFTDFLVSEIPFAFKTSVLLSASFQGLVTSAFLFLIVYLFIFLVYFSDLPFCVEPVRFLPVHWYHLSVSI